MTTDFITIKIPLSQNAWQALRDFAQRDRRVPADQASVLLEKLLARRQRTGATNNKDALAVEGEGVLTATR